jgi:hypothetical protein
MFYRLLVQYSTCRTLIVQPPDVCKICVNQHCSRYTHGPKGDKHPLLLLESDARNLLENHWAMVDNPTYLIAVTMLQNAINALARKLFSATQHLSSGRG